MIGVVHLCDALLQGRKIGSLIHGGIGKQLFVETATYSAEFEAGKCRIKLEVNAANTEGYIVVDILAYREEVREEGGKIEVITGHIQHDYIAAMQRHPDIRWKMLDSEVSGQNMYIAGLKNTLPRKVCRDLQNFLLAWLPIHNKDKIIL